MLFTFFRSMPKVIDASHIHFTIVYEHIGKLLRCLITIDNAVSSNAFLQSHWKQYKLLVFKWCQCNERGSLLANVLYRMLQQVGHNPSNFGVDATQLKPLDKLMTRFESSIINCNLFQVCRLLFSALWFF